MFGPNSYYPNMHHREKSFVLLMRDVEFWFRRIMTRAGVYEAQYDVIPVSGSGTFALELVLASLAKPHKAYVETTGHFSDRLRTSLALKQNGFPAIAWRNIHLRVRYETAEAVEGDWRERKKATAIYDCVSSFPYFDVPLDAAAFVTVTSKQLGGAPGASIVCVKKNAWDLFLPSSPTYLSLRRYFDVYRTKNQTPNTPCVHAIASAAATLELHHAAFHEKIDAINKRREMLEKALGTGYSGTGPVINISTTRITPKLAHDYALYKNAAATQYQLFLWTGDDEQYRKFCERVGGE